LCADEVELEATRRRVFSTGSMAPSELVPKRRSKTE
jgi:hypothetical protein